MELLANWIGIRTSIRVNPRSLGTLRSVHGDDVVKHLDQMEFLCDSKIRLDPVPVLDLTGVGF